MCGKDLFLRVFVYLTFFFAYGVRKEVLRGPECGTACESARVDSRVAECIAKPRQGRTVEMSRRFDGMSHKKDNSELFRFEMS